MNERENMVYDWWKDQVYELNNTLIEIIGKKLGYVPVENLLDIPEEFGFDELFYLEEILNKEGLKTKWEDNELKVFIK